MELLSESRSRNSDARLCLSFYRDRSNLQPRVWVLNLCFYFKAIGWIFFIRFLFMRCIVYEDRERAKRTGKVGRKRGVRRPFPWYSFSVLCFWFELFLWSILCVWFCVVVSFRVEWGVFSACKWYGYESGGLLSYSLKSVHVSDLQELNVLLLSESCRWLDHVFHALLNWIVSDLLAK